MSKIADRILVDTEVMRGKPVIAGTGISVYVVLNLLAGGFNLEQVLKEYPDLTFEGV